MHPCFMQDSLGIEALGHYGVGHGVLLPALGHTCPQTALLPAAHSSAIPAVNK